MDRQYQMKGVSCLITGRAIVASPSHFEQPAHAASLRDLASHRHQHSHGCRCCVPDNWL